MDRTYSTWITRITLNSHSSTYPQQDAIHSCPALIVLKEDYNNNNNNNCMVRIILQTTFLFNVLTFFIFFYKNAFFILVIDLFYICAQYGIHLAPSER